MHWHPLLGLHGKEQNFEQLCDTLNFYSSQTFFFRKISVWRSVAIWTLLIGCSITFFYLYHSSSPEVLTPSYCQIEVPQGPVQIIIA